MRARMMVEKPDEIEMTLKVTMSMREWEKLRDQLAEKWPSARLGSAITGMLTEARRVYHAQEVDAFDRRDLYTEVDGAAPAESVGQ